MCSIDCGVFHIILKMNDVFRRMVKLNLIKIVLSMLKNKCMFLKHLDILLISLQSNGNCLQLFDERIIEKLSAYNTLLLLSIKESILFTDRIKKNRSQHRFFRNTHVHPH